MSLLVVGTLGLDFIETPGGQRDQVLGGSAAFLATAAAFFVPVSMTAVVGDDFPAEHLAFFAERQIDTQGVEQLPGRTFRWHGRYGQDLNVAQTVETQLNVLENYHPELLPAVREASYVVLGNISPALQEKVLDQLRAPALVACDTMNYWISGHNAVLRRILPRIDLLCINEAEARQLSGEHNLLRAVTKIRAMGPRFVVVKRGEYGVLMVDDGGTFALPAFPLDQICDPTGAGDSFAGGMMGFIAAQRRCDGDTLRQAVAVGSVVASYVVQDFSLDALRHLQPASLLARLQQFAHLSRFTAEGIHVS